MGMDGLDILIAQSLQSQWKHREPSSRVWRRIRRRIALLTSPEIPNEYFLNHPLRPRSESLFVPPFHFAGSLVLCRYDLMLMQLV